MNGIAPKNPTRIFYVSKRYCRAEHASIRESKHVAPRDTGMKKTGLMSSIWCCWWHVAEWDNRLERRPRRGERTQGNSLGQLNFRTTPHSFLASSCNQQEEQSRVPLYDNVEMATTTTTATLTNPRLPLKNFSHASHVVRIIVSRLPRSSVRTP